MVFIAKAGYCLLNFNLKKEIVFAKAIFLFAFLLSLFSFLCVLLLKIKRTVKSVCKQKKVK